MALVFGRACVLGAKFMPDWALRLSLTAAGICSAADRDWQVGFGMWLGCMADWARQVGGVQLKNPIGSHTGSAVERAEQCTFAS